MLLIEKNDGNIRRKQSNFILTSMILLLFFGNIDSLVYNCNTVISDSGVIDYRNHTIGDPISFCVHFLPFNVKATFSTNPQ